MPKHSESATGDVEAAPGSTESSAPSPAMAAEHRSCFLGKLLVFRSLSDARKHKTWEKWLFTAIISLAAAVAPLQSTMLMPALPEVAVYFGVSRALANLSIAFYALSMAIVPLWWSVISELYGRRPVYVISFALFLLWNILAAKSTSIDMLIVMRVLAGGASASVQAVGAGSVADLWQVEHRGTAMSYFFLGPMVGPLVSPIIGGILTDTLGWRSTQWATVVYGGLVWFLIVFCLPETSPNLPGIKSLDPPGGYTGVSAARRATYRVGRLCFQPLLVLKFFRFPPVAITIYCGSITFASYYALNMAIQTVFSEKPYSYSAIIIGLLYIPSALGSITASLFGGRWMDYIMRRQAARAGRYDSSGQLIFRPGDRMGENAWFAAILYPAALLWFGWTADKHVFWFVPALATFFFGLGNNLIFNMATTMLTEFMPKRASNGVALNNLLRNTLGCVMAVIAEPLINAIGAGWLFFILAIISWSSVVVVWMMKRNGSRWAEEMAEKLSTQPAASVTKEKEAKT